MSAGIAQARATARRARQRRALVVAALACGLLLRLAFAFGYWVGKPLTIDEQEYLMLARSVAAGRGLTYPPGANAARTSRHFERPPVFPALLGTVLAVTGSGATADGSSPLPASSSEVPISVKLVQALLGVVAVGLVAAVARQAAGEPAGIIAAWIAAVYPPLVWTGGYVFSESLYSVLAFTVVWLLHRAVRGAEPPASLGAATTTADERGQPAGPLRLGASQTTLLSVFAAGAVAGVALLTKEHMVFFVPLAALWLFAAGMPAAAGRKIAWGKRGLLPLVFVVGTAIALTPWIARNYGVYGRFVLTAPHGGITFWTGNNAFADGEGDLAANPAMGQARVEFEARHAGVSIEELDRAYYRDAFAFITGHPVRWLELVARKFFYTFVPIGKSYRLHSPLYFGTTLASYASVFALALLGAGTLRRHRRWRAGAALWLLAASAVAMSLVFFSQERFRIPVLDPTLIVCAAAWIGSRARVAHWFATVR